MRENNGAFFLDCVSLKYKKYATICLIFLIFIYIIFILLLDFAMLSLYAYIIYKGDVDTNKNIDKNIVESNNEANNENQINDTYVENIKSESFQKFNFTYIFQNISGAAVLFSTALTFVINAILMVFEKRIGILNSIINHMLNKLYNFRYKKYCSDINDECFNLANKIVYSIKNEKGKEIINLFCKNQINFSDLIYSIYFQLYGSQQCVLLKGKDFFKDYTERIIIYDFANAPNYRQCQEFIGAYKHLNFVSNVVIIANMNYLSGMERMHIRNSLQTKYMLANNVFEIKNEYSFIFKSVLDKIGINLTDFKSFNDDVKIIVVLILINSVWGYIPSKAIKRVFSPHQRLNIYKLKMLVGHTNGHFVARIQTHFNEYKSSKMYKLDLESAIKYIKENKNKLAKNNSSAAYNVLLENTLEFFYDNQKYCAYVEMSAAMQKTNVKDFFSAIDKLLGKDCFIAVRTILESLDYIKTEKKLYNNQTEKLKLCTYYALILERCGDIEGANKILQSITVFPVRLSLSNELEFDYSVRPKNKSLFAKYLFIAFENLHGELINRNHILSIIPILMENKFILKRDLPMLEYWNLHAMLEEGNKFVAQQIKNWITKNKHNLSVDENYTEMHKLRRAYSDYANSFYCRNLILFNDNNEDEELTADKQCLIMLNQISDNKLLTNLACYTTHYRRMAIGDFIMNYCIPKIVYKKWNVPIEMKNFLHTHGYNNKEYDAESMANYALSVYEECFNEFFNGNDKSAKTTKTRICNAKMALNDIDDSIADDIDGFYKNSKYEVFRAYGIALKLKYYTLKLFRLNLYDVDEMLYKEEIPIHNDKMIIVQIDNKQDMISSYKYKKILAVLDAILKIFNEEIDPDQCSKQFSEFSRNRFEFFRKVLLERGGNVLTNISNYASTHKISADLEEIIKKTANALEQLNEKPISTSITGIEKVILDSIDSYSSLIDKVKYYPVVLL